MVHTAPPVSRGPLTEPAAGRRTRPATTWAARLVSAPPVWRELALIALFYTAYTLTRLVLNGGGTAAAFSNADRILAFERALELDVELGLNRWLLQEPWLARAANYYYGIAHFAVTLAIVVWLYRYRPQDYRWLRTALMAATAVALIGYWLYPLAPPRFLPDEGFVDPVQALGSWGLYSGRARARWPTSTRRCRRCTPAGRSGAGSCWPGWERTHWPRRSACCTRWSRCW